jgi:hypothetical protein
MRHAILSRNRHLTLRNVVEAIAITAFVAGAVIGGTCAVVSIVSASPAPLDCTGFPTTPCKPLTNNPV